MNIALIFAGGTGTRMGKQARPKQFLELHGKPVIIYTLQAFDQHKDIDAIVVVCKKDWIDFLNKKIAEFGLKKIAGVVCGGASGQESIYQGLKFCDEHHTRFNSNNTATNNGNSNNKENSSANPCASAHDDVAPYMDDVNPCVLVHDGVRPLIDEATITRCIESVQKYGNAITVVDSIETIVREQNSVVQEIVDRTSCKMARAPQAFYLKDLLQAHNQAKKDCLTESFIDSASLMQHYGHTLYVVKGNRENIKITTPIDFYSFAGLVDGAAGVFGSTEDM